MAPLTTLPLPGDPETTCAPVSCPASVDAAAELHLAARLARWLADVAIATGAAPDDEHLDDAA